ncbi:MAG: hypothetical protein JWP25_4898 [Bradyrhizobium sp.]|nr:hypothetical protein [Bradyrhizobium sp.]
MFTEREQKHTGVIDAVGWRARCDDGYSAWENLVLQGAKSRAALELIVDVQGKRRITPLLQLLTEAHET